MTPIASHLTAFFRERLPLQRGASPHTCCQNENDRYKYQGCEIHFLQIDEAGHFPHSIYSYLRSRVRLGNLPIPERFKGKLPLTLPYV